MGMAKNSVFLLVGLRVQCSFPMLMMKFHGIFIIGDDFMADFTADMGSKQICVIRGCHNDTFFQSLL